MHDYHGHGRGTLRLPVAMAQDLNFRLDLKKAIFGRRQHVSSGQEVSGNRLRVAVEERPARAEWLSKVVARGGGFSRRSRIVCRLAHELIVGGDDRRLLSL